VLGLVIGLFRLPRAQLSHDVVRGRRARADGDLHFGGAGFRLAKALIAPATARAGMPWSRGRIAARMIGAVVTLLVIAGTIEGLLSASDAPAIWKYAVSARPPYC